MVIYHFIKLKVELNVDITEGAGSGHDPGLTKSL